MKTKKLFLCLMLLLMSASSAWADKYYQPGSYKGTTTPRLTLEQAVGQKFMIYNTAIDGNVDRTGFLRNNGVNFEYDKSKERDLYVYNESFVYTMEKYTDGTGTWYAIKSVNTGLYVNINGKTDIGSASDAKLYITDWDNATGKSTVNMESWKYEVTANGAITTSGHGSTVFVVKNGDTYWNGNTDSFATYSNGHPFAFYIAHEVTSGEYLQDLHIYSRIDIFSAQQTYGYVQKPSQITANPSYTEQGGFENLIDGVASTYNVTDWRSAADGHYYQIDLEQSVESLYLYMQRRADGKNAPVKFELQACATADGNYTKIGEYTTNLATSAFYTTSDAIVLGDSYQYLRIVAMETTTPDSNCMGLSELSVLPNTKEVQDAIGYINAVQSSPLFTKTTAKAYAALVEEYNRRYSDARLLSGVPIPGNKYRIYADTYDRDNSRYVNREIMANSEGLLVKDPGAYHAADADGKKQHEWYCEQTADGKLVFRNVADPTKYLAYGTVAAEPYKWSINTVFTTHYGVPLMNNEMQYLAVTNDGLWQRDVKSAQNQHQPYIYTVTDDKGNDDATDDVTTTNTIEGGVCTDFLFIPVSLDATTEKKITIRAGELVARNTKLLYDSDNNGTPEVFPLPFSRMFKKTDGSWGNLPTMQLLCSDLHSYAGVKINNGETLVTVETTPKVTYNEATSTLSFNFDEIKSGDVFDVQLEIKAPFVYSEPDMSKEVQPTLYIIKNKRPQAVQQQARPNRTAVNVDIEIGGGGDDGPISSQTGAYYYAKFDSRNSNMALVQHDGSFDAHSLFYFTQTEDTDTDEYYAARIHNVTTVMKCASDISWNANGNTWYVQPNKTTSYTGYNIATTILNATNNPDDTWCSNHANGDRILRYNANDDGSAWEFEEVTVAEAKTLLMQFISNVAVALTTELGSITAEQAAANGYDMAKIGQYISIVEQLQQLAEGYYNAENIAKLVQYAQNIHMIEHEIDYALYALPELTDEENFEKGDFSSPHWYYVRNVMNEDYYVAHAGDETPMSLGQCKDGKALKNMFYFVGEKNTYATSGYKDFPGNNLIIDEYLKVHVHNFVSKRLTLVSKNVQLSKNSEPITPGKGEQEVVNGLSLKSDENWSIELEYDLDHDFQAYNAYGSCLLASANPLKDDYPNEFQVYLKDDRSLVIKVNNKYDTYRFWHTQDHFTHIKVVITYSQNNVTLDVYNSLGEKESKTVKDVTMKDITTLYSALPESGATITNLSTYQVETMTWKGHVIDASKDEWYILPSSNLDNKGMAIVLEEPNDLKMGWANANGENRTIETDLGTSDYSTWKFERVTDFDGHIDELLEMYNFEDCVIYDRELAKLMALIQRNEAIIKAAPNGAGEEAAFNEVYYAIINYTGRMPEHLKAPTPGFLYTIRPAVEEYTQNALLVHIDKGNGTYSTKELYNGNAMLDENNYDSRAAWLFEGATGSTITGLKAKNIHTQCYMTPLGADASAVNEEGAADITLAPLGACTTMFQVGEQYMNRTAVAATISYDKNANNFWGSAVTASAGINAVIDVNSLGEGTVHCKSTDIEVRTTGDETTKDVTVTFTYDDGDHKINVLGVELVAIDGKVKYSDYRYQTAGSSPNNIKTYTLAGVFPGTYTLNCYVYDPASGDDLGEHIGHIDIAGVAAVSGEGKVLSNGTASTRWIVEEIKNPETTVCYETTIEEGYSTLMLGFDAQIPEDIEAYTGAIDGIVVDRKYLSMTKYEGATLAANTPVVLRNSDEGVGRTARFYVSTIAGEPEEDSYLRGSLYHTVVSTDAIEEKVGASINIYMLQSGKTGPMMYWIYEEYDAKGELVEGGNNDLGKHVLCKANKAYIVIKSGEANGRGSFMFMLNRGETTGIDDVEGEVEEVETIYDLQGRRLQEITHPGVYVVNGRKIVVK